MEFRSSASKAPRTPHSHSSSAASTGTPSTPGLWSVSHARVRREVEAWTARRHTGSGRAREFGVEPSRALGSRRNVTPIPAGVPLGNIFNAGTSSPGQSALGAYGRVSEISASFEADLPQEAIDYLVTDVTFVWVHNTSAAPNTVLVTGSFLKWREVRQLQRDTEDPRLWTHTEPLAPGVHQYKFIVDNVWRHSPDQPTIVDERGIVNNILIVNVELCGDQSCFCARIYNKINSRVSDSGGGADGSHADLPGPAGNRSLLSIQPLNAGDERNISRDSASANTQRIALKGHTGVALEYKEKRRAGKGSRAVAELRPRSLASLVGIQREQAQGRLDCGDARLGRADDVQGTAASQNTAQRMGDGTVDEALPVSSHDAGDRASLTAADSKMQSGCDPSAAVNLDSETPVPSKTFMHHDINDAPFEATVVPDARDLLSAATELFPLEHVLKFEEQRQQEDRDPEHISTAQVVNGDHAQMPTRDGVEGVFPTGETAGKGDASGLDPSQIPSGRLSPKAVSHDRTMRVMHLVTVAAAESESNGMQSWQTKHQSGHGEDSSWVAKARSLPLEHNTSSEGAAELEIPVETPASDAESSPWEPRQRPPRRNAVGRDGGDVIPEGAMSRVSSLNEIRMQHAQLLMSESDVQIAGTDNRSGSREAPERVAAAPCRVGDSTQPQTEAVPKPGLLARTSSVDAILRPKRVPLELQYALRAEFSSPSYGFDPQSCAADIVLSAGNQCASLRPQHSGMYRSVRGLLPVPPGSYFEVLFAPLADADTGPQPVRSIVDSKVQGRRRNVSGSSRAPAKRTEVAAACVGIAPEAEGPLTNALLGGQPGSIGFHTKGYVVRWNAERKLPEWHRVVFLGAPASSVESVLAKAESVIGVLRTHSNRGVRFFVNGIEVVPLPSELTESVFNNGEWLCPSGDRTTESDTFRPIVSLFASSARVYAAFSSDALRYASTAASSFVSSSSTDSASSLSLQCLDGESVDLQLPSAPE